MSGDLSYGLEEQAGLISWYVGVWHDLGYENPPTPDCKPIPPLGERSAQAVKGARDAIGEIGNLIRQLHALRAQLVSELRQNEDIMAGRGKPGSHLQAEPGAQLAGDEPLPGCPTCGAPSIPLRAPGPDSAAVLCLSCGPALSQPPQTPAGGE